MSAQDAWAIVPVKAFANAKRRLSGILSADQRCELARLMFLDLIDTIAAARLGGFTVVTSDKEAARFALAAGGQVDLEPYGSGLNEAVLAGMKHARDREPALLIVPIDLPYLEPQTLVRAGSVALGGWACVAPAARDGGTNLLALPAATDFAPNFGPNSFRLHLAQFRRAGLPAHVLAAPDAQFDLDTRDDLEILTARPPNTRTGRLVAQLADPARELLRGTA